MFRRCVALCVSQNLVPSRLLSRSVILNVMKQKGPSGPVLEIRIQGQVKCLLYIESRIQGQVRWFDAIKGFGFITRNDGKEDVFVHLTSIRGKNPAHQTRTLADGEPVEFDVVQGKAGFEAIEVTGPCGTPVQGNPLGVQTRRQMQNGVGTFSALDQQNPGAFAPPNFSGAGAGYGGTPTMGRFNPPPQGFGNPFPTQQGYGSPFPSQQGFGSPAFGGFGGGQMPGANNGLGSPAPDGYGYRAADGRF